MSKIQDIQVQITAAMKNKQTAEVQSLRTLLNQIKLIAKDQGNRDPQDDDVITAANRIIKQNRETLGFLDGNDDRSIALQREIEIVQTFLPRQLDETELVQLLTNLAQEAVSTGNPKSARGFIMKNLNAKYRGQFDAQKVNTLVGPILERVTV